MDIRCPPNTLMFLWKYVMSNLQLHNLYIIQNQFWTWIQFKASNLLHITLIWTHIQCNAMGVWSSARAFALNFLSYKLYQGSFIHASVHHLLGQTTTHLWISGLFKIDRYSSAKEGRLVSSPSIQKSCGFCANF